MAKLNRACGICKTKYSYCPTCAADAHKPTWMAVFCSENCREIYNVLDDCRYRSLSKKEAYERLSVVDLSCTDKLPGYFKETLDEILEEGKEKVNVEEVISEEIITTPVVIEEAFEEKNIVIKEQSVEEIAIKDEVIEEIKKPRPKKKAKFVE